MPERWNAGYKIEKKNDKNELVLVRTDLVRFQQMPLVWSDAYKTEPGGDMK